MMVKRFVLYRNESDVYKSYLIATDRLKVFCIIINQMYNKRERSFII